MGNAFENYFSDDGYSINPLNSEFREKLVEVEYRAARHPSNLRQAIYMFLCLGGFLALGAVRDLFAFGDDPATLTQLFSYRLIGVLASFGLAFAVYRWPPGETLFNLIYLGSVIMWTIVWGAASVVYYGATGSIQSQVLFPGILIFTLLFYCGPVWQGLLAAAGIILISVVTHAWIMVLPTETVIFNVMVCAGFVAAGLPMLLIVQRSRRNDFISLMRQNQLIDQLRDEVARREASERELKQYQDSLEETVERRTEALEKSNQQLQVAQKMESIGHLAGGIAHDFNNLLQVIQGYGEFVLDQLPEDSPLRRDQEQILKAGERGGNLVRQLLAFSRRQVLEREQLDVGAVVEELVELIKPVMGAQISVRPVVRSALGPVLIDRGQIEQVLINLCINARDAMPKGGALTIELEQVRIGSDELGMYALEAPGDYVRVSVTDDGEGIEPAVMPRIFDPFYSTKEKSRGTGLGLSSALGIIQQHGGTIRCASEPGQGTCFEVLLRVSQGEETAKPLPVAPGHVPSGETILLADDEEMVRDVTRRMLDASGYRTIVASNGEEALALARSESIDLLLLDVVMPGMSGREVAEIMMTEKPHVPVLLCTGYNSDAANADFLLDSSEQIILKPFTIHALQAKLAKLLAQPVE